ncbi:hypothetical protein RhiirA5_434075 [Rhizophagus irregularis]|uniref:RNA-dependent RNA polymerase n=1 Tax=Rhizophagus irregularis TaxID=588596 RepID=A0A2N0NQN9_9GLOM|nr:hypothetical protein RhiirA5_434075 [Rhizophagus irregularis]
MVRKVVVTPTTSYILTPTMETSNWVIRYFRDKKDHFLRVQFVDKVLSKVGSSNDDTSNHCMTEFIFGWGIRGTKDNTIHRRFDLRLGRVPGGLYNTWKMAKNGTASSHQHSRVKSDLIRSSSLQGFEGPTDHDTHGQYNMRRLHKSSGTTLLSNIAEELWTCFSSTRAIQKLPIDDIKEIPDIVRNGVFYVNQLVLEVIRGSTFIYTYLKRQAIILLSALGIPDELFIELKDLRVRK